VTGEPSWIVWGAAAVVLIAVALAWWIWAKGRPFADGDVFRASRLSAGNRLFPTQVLVTATSVVQYTPRWVGRREETIHMAHIASVKIDTGLMFSDVLIETSGGTDPVICHGHRKGDAVRMKNLIEGYQTAYFRGNGPVGASGPGR
jgi:hypothetical protein